MTKFKTAIPDMMRTILGLTKKETHKSITSGINDYNEQLLYKYKDVVVPVLQRTTGSGRPTLATVIGNFKALLFNVNDSQNSEPTEIPHDWKIGTPLEIHVHWLTGDDSDNTERGIKWELEYTYAGMHQPIKTPETLSAETIVKASEGLYVSYYTSLGVFTPELDNIGGQILLNIKRVESNEVAPTWNPFLLQIGIHYIADGLGSNQMDSK